MLRSRKRCEDPAASGIPPHFSNNAHFPVQPEKQGGGRHKLSRTLLFVAERRIAVSAGDKGSHFRRYRPEPVIQ